MRVQPQAFPFSNVAHDIGNNFGSIDILPPFQGPAARRPALTLASDAAKPPRFANAHSSLAPAEPPVHTTFRAWGVVLLILSQPAG